MTTPRRRRPSSRSAATFTLACAGCSRGGGYVPTAEAWTSATTGRSGGGVVVVANPQHQSRGIPLPFPCPSSRQLPPVTTTRGVLLGSRQRCRPRRDGGGSTELFERRGAAIVDDGGGGSRGFGDDGDGDGESGLLRRLRTASNEGLRRRARRLLLRARGSAAGGTATMTLTTTTVTTHLRTRRFWRRLVAGLAAATLLLCLSPRVAAAASTIAASAAEGVAGTAAAEAGAVAAGAVEAAAIAAGTAVAEASTVAAGAAATEAAAVAAGTAGAATVAAGAGAATTAASTAAVTTAAAAQELVRPLGTLQVLPTRAEMELSLRLLFAALGGAAVGLERSSSDRPAGVRTMALVSLGAAAFTLCSMYGFMSVGALVGPNGPVTKYDPSRMASNVASGVGFIGAGVITNNRKAAGVYDRQSTVGGLTTAAAIWTSAAIGVANGVGLYFIGATAAVSTILILRFGHLKHDHLWNGDGVSVGVASERDAVKVGSKKKKKVESATTPVLDGVVDVDSMGANATAIMMEAYNSTATASKPSAVALAGDDIAQTKDVAINAQLDEMNTQEDGGDDAMPSTTTSGGGATRSRKPKRHEADEKVRQSSDRSGSIVTIQKKAGGSSSKTAAAVSSFEDDDETTILEIQKPPKAPKEKTKTKTTEELPPFMDAPPLPPSSSADPLLEKYLWGVDNFETTAGGKGRGGDDDISSGGGESSSSQPRRHSIEEDQEVVFRDGGVDKTNGERKDGGSP